MLAHEQSKKKLFVQLNKSYVLWNCIGLLEKEKIDETPALFL